MSNKLVKTRGWQPLPGEEVYSVATGRINPHKSGSIRAARYIRKLRGFMTAVHAKDSAVWFFDSLSAAVAAQESMDKVKIGHADKIGLFRVNERCELDYVKEVVENLPLRNRTEGASI